MFLMRVLEKFSSWVDQGLCREVARPPLFDGNTCAMNPGLTTVFDLLRCKRWGLRVGCVGEEGGAS